MTVVVRDIKRRKIYDFLSEVQFEEPMSVTLTEKKYFIGFEHTKFWNDKIRSPQNTKHFLNRINQTIFKNSFHRYGKRLKSFVVMEQSSIGNQPHIHMIMEKPNRFSVDEFTEVINQCWSKTNFGYQHTDVRKIYSDGWLDYLLKDRSKVDLLSDIDWENTHIGLSK